MFSCRRCIKIVKDAKKGSCAARWNFDTSSTAWEYVENKWITNPEFATVNVLDLESLFAGKLHAILCRSYKNNVKGRDYYDFIFYINKKIKPNLLYLKITHL